MKFAAEQQKNGGEKSLHKNGGEKQSGVKFVDDGDVDRGSSAKKVGAKKKTIQFGEVVEVKEVSEPVAFAFAHTDLQILLFQIDNCQPIRSTFKIIRIFESLADDNFKFCFDKTGRMPKSWIDYGRKNKQRSGSSRRPIQVEVFLKQNWIKTTEIVMKFMNLH